MSLHGPFNFLLLVLFAAALNAQGIQIIRQRPMDFGNLIAESPGGSVTLTPDSQLVLGADRRVRGFQNASPHGALFRITGPPGRRITVELDPLSPSFNYPSGRLRIAAFQLGLPNPDCQLNNQGYLDVFLGATLDVSAGNQAGPFSLDSARIIIRDRDAKLRDPGIITAPCPIRAFVRAPLTLERKSDLYFGDILLRPEGGELRVEPGGQFSWKDNRHPEFLKNRPRAARFQVSGSTEAQVGVQIPIGIVILKNASGQTIRLKDFTTDAGRSVRLPDSGPLTFEVGATLEIAPNQAPGAYRGTFTVSVNYL